MMPRAILNSMKVLQVAAAAAVKNNGVFGTTQLDLRVAEKEAIAATEKQNQENKQVADKDTEDTNKQVADKDTEDTKKQVADKDTENTKKQVADNVTESKQRDKDEVEVIKIKTRKHKRRHKHKRSKKNKHNRDESSTATGSDVSDVDNAAAAAASSKPKFEVISSGDDADDGMEAKKSTKSKPKIQGILLVDQGGGSFKMIFMGRRHGDVRKFHKLRSKDNIDLVHPELLQCYKDCAGQEMLDMKTGLFTDCSAMSTNCYKAYCDVIAQYYVAVRDKLMTQLHNEKTSHTFHATKLVVRQTGKIRRVLLKDNRAADKFMWNECMTSALGASFPDMPVDYALMTNSMESNLEGKAFFKFSPFSSDIPKHDIIALAVGSSSTQAFTLGSDGRLVTNHDSALGALTVANASCTADSLKDQFLALLKPVLAAPSKKPKSTIVALNAMGFLLEDMAKADWEEHDVFKAKMMKEGTTFSPLEFLIFSKRFSSISDSYTAKFIRGFAGAMNSVQSVTRLQLERKKSLGKSLPYSSSWILSLGYKNLPREKRGKKRDSKKDSRQKRRKSKEGKEGAPAPPSGKSKGAPPPPSGSRATKGAPPPPSDAS